ncbi:MAG: GIY-YIG nuclease family protein [Patescibacteria group bacterium]
MYYVYILICSEERLYTGCTDDLKQRLHRHQSGHVLATKGYLPVRLHGYMAINNKEKAFALEKYLKSGSGRAFLRKHLL